MQGDGCTLREHLEVIERTSGVTPEQLIPLPFPYELSHVWAWFQRMNQMRQAGGFGISRLSSEIVAWQQMESIQLNPFELDVILQLDGVFVEHHSKSKDEAAED